MKAKRVFLGGTCNGSTWRDGMIPKLEIDHFNPVVPEWNEEAYQRELYEREHCDYLLYTITPKAKGFYSIAEVIDDSNKRPDKTVFCLLTEDDGEVFEKFQLKSLQKVGEMVRENGGTWCESLDEVIDFFHAHAPA